MVCPMEMLDRRLATDLGNAESMCVNTKSLAEYHDDADAMNHPSVLQCRLDQGVAELGEDRGQQEWWYDLE
jgi:hypothetical protein